MSAWYVRAALGVFGSLCHDSAVLCKNPRLCKEKVPGRFGVPQDAARCMEFRSLEMWAGAAPAHK